MSIRSVTLFFTILLSLVSHYALASNRYYADNDLEPTPGFAWDWSIGAGYFISDSYLAGTDPYNDGLELNLNIELSYNRFYLDIDNSQLSGGLTLGYSLIDKYDWGLDIIGSNMQGEIDQYGAQYDGGTPPDELAGIHHREYDFDAGLRLSRRFGDSQVSFELLNDISGAHGGILLNSFFSHIQVWRNWEFRSALGVSTYSSDFINYYYGVSQEEATSIRPAYQAKTGYNIQFEFHSEYPLTEDWVLIGGILSTWFSSAISNSPIVSQNYQHKAKVGIRYVF